MKRTLIIVLGSFILATPALLMAQAEGGGFDQITIVGKEPIERKPASFYYEIDPYQPIEVLLGANQFILDNNLITQVEKSVGKSTFIADPYLLRIPVSVSDVYDIDRTAITIDVSPYQERGVSSWEVQILDARGVTFRIVQGGGSLPTSITWNGRGDQPTDVMSVGDIYSFIVILTMRDGSQMRKIGRPLDLNGLAYENVVAVKESEIESYDMVMPAKIANYYQFVLNRFKETNYTGIHIIASNLSLAEAARNYLASRLYNVKITTQEMPEYARVEFIFQ